MLTIRRSIIPSTNRNYPHAKLNAGNLWITVHETGNSSPGANARGEESFMWGGGGPESVAYHLTVDHREAIQLLPFDIVGWHAGDGCDSRTQDVGCYASIAIEVCVGDNNAHKDKTRANLIELIEAILKGDSRFHWAGTDHRRFSVERIAPHKRWSSYSKECPRYMLADGYFWTIQSKVQQKLSSGGTVKPIYASPKPIPELAKYKSGDRNTIPAVVILSDGTPAYFVCDTVEAIRDTPRLQLAYEGAPVLNEPVRKGETFRVDWVFVADDGEHYYLTPWDTRIRVADTRRVQDGAAA